MSSDKSFIETAREIIKRNPEYFEALAEFDRTGKLPKITFKKRIDITVDKDIINKFKEFCRKKGYKVSNRIEQLIIRDLYPKEVNKWGK